jgi:hypothetical protein
MESSVVARGDERTRLIQQKAYEIYVSRGCVGGREVEDWLAAERAVDAEIARKKTATKAAPPSGPRAVPPEPAPSKSAPMGGLGEKIKGKFRRASG